MRAARSWREKGVDGGIGRVQRKGGGDEESYREGERKEGYGLGVGVIDYRKWQLNQILR